MKLTPATLVIALAFVAAGGYGLYRLGMNQGIQIVTGFLRTRSGSAKSR